MTKEYHIKYENAFSYQRFASPSVKLVNPEREYKTFFGPIQCWFDFYHPNFKFEEFGKEQTKEEFLKDEKKYCKEDTSYWKEVYDLAEEFTYNIFNSKKETNEFGFYYLRIRHPYKNKSYLFPIERVEQWDFINYTKVQLLDKFLGITEAIQKFN